MWQGVAKSQFVVVDGKEGKEYDGIVAGSLKFSPDSKHLAYVAVRGEKRFVVVDGKEGKEYDGIGQAVSNSVQTASIWLMWQSVAESGLS